MTLPRLARVFERIAALLRYGFRRKCALCGAYDAHHLMCEAPRTKADWKRMARQYYEAWLRDHARSVRDTQSARDRAALWQGKFHTLRLENNALRRKLRRVAPPEGTGPADDAATTPMDAAEWDPR